MTNDSELLELARRLWEDAELRVLSSPWTQPTLFEGKVRQHFIELARATNDGGSK